MFDLFKKKENQEDDALLTAVAAILIHSAKIDENFTSNEKNIIKNSLIEMGGDLKKIDAIIENAEIKEQNSNQILDFTKEVKNLSEDEKKIIVESLWKVIYSDSNADMYESSLMRKLSGLLYLDNKMVGDLKEKVKKKL
tara:strand:+ start:1416 stop:1832 length:417 start_codon:yes stop_codon:yes gene_type:complete